MLRPTLEFLEARQMLTVTAVIDANNDALITGTAGADVVTMSIENQGLANQTLRISDPGGVTAGAGFTQEGANSATVLTSAITGLDIFINTLGADDTINVQATPAGILTHANEGGGLNNVINVSSNAPTNTGNLDGLDGTLTLDNAVGGGGRTLNISESGSAAADTVNINTLIADAFTGTAGGGWTIQEVNLGSPLVNLSLGSGGDRVNVNGELAGERVNINTGAGADTVAFANGVTLSGGVVDGGADGDTLDYSAYTTSVATNLGLDVSGLAATLGGDQENPPQNTIAAGTATVSNYDHINKTFDITVTVTDLNPALVTGFHIHRGQFGVNGPIIIDFVPGGVPIAPITPVGTGFTFTATGLDLDNSLLGGRVNEASFLGGTTYVNVHTAEAPGGLIRGQLFSTGNINVANGTATGTGGVTGVENVIGSSAMDGLIGNFSANSLEGRAANDTLVGGPAADTFSGGNDNDIMVWSNGDGSDVMNGDAGSDTVQVNGSLTADDVFSIGANGTRVDFDRTSPGPFSLDIGTTETLTPIGVVGADSFSVGSLVGVADLSNVHLGGLEGNDSFTITPSATLNFLVSGGTPTTAPGDSLTVDVAGTTGASATETPDGLFQFTGAHNPISYRGIESLNSVNGAFSGVVFAGGGNNVLRAFRDGAEIVVASDGSEVFRADAADVNALFIFGEGGNDSLVVDFTTGDPVPSGGIDFDGGPGSDAMGVRGDGTNNAVYTPSATTPGNGTVVVDGTNTITFSNLAPIDIFGMNNATINLPNANDDLDIQEGVDFTQGGTEPALRVSGTSGGVAIETAAFFDNTTMIVDTTATDGAADDITIISANNAHNNTNITINTGVGANDLLTVNGVTTVAGTFTGNVPTINLNNVINAATITGTATVINVDDPGQIQDAHDLAASLAPPGALVNVASGTYNENVVISKNLRIDGIDTNNKPVVDGGAAGSVFTIGAFTVLLQDLVIQNGAAPDGGGIHNSGTLTVRRVQVQNNVANGVSGSGGGIFNNTGGTLDIHDSRITGNRANRAGGGIEENSGGAGVRVTLTDVTLDDNNAGVAPAAANPGNGGGLHVTGSSNVTINGGVVANNRAAREGGGLWNDNGVMILNGVDIAANIASGNAADDGGGGLFNDGGTVDINAGTMIRVNSATGASGSGGGIFNNTGGTITIDNSRISGNVANRAGGGIEDNVGNLITIVDSTIADNAAALVAPNPGNGGGVHITGAGRVTLDGSTVSGNIAQNEGGGLWNSATGAFTLTNSTISTNTATNGPGGGIFNTSGGLVDLDSVTITRNSAPSGDGIAAGDSGVTMQNTIVADNPAGTFGQNLTGVIQSDDFNLIGDSNNGTLAGFVANTIFNADPKLGPLSFNGGPTQTHLPLAGSPAIGFGNTTLTVDQRNVARPQGGEDDIGAVEVDLNGFVVSANDLAAGQAGDGNPDSFLIKNGMGTVDVTINGTLVHSFNSANTGLIVIRGSADDDTLTVDNSMGLIGAKIVFDGDGTGGPAPFPTPGGLDRLRLIGSTPTTTTYNPGETPDAGVVYQENNQIVQRVEFFGLEPVEVRGTGAGDTLVVAGTLLGVGFPQALNADNAINYTQGSNSGNALHPVFMGDTTGEVTVDGFERLEFSNFGTLEIDAGAGSDVINLNNSTTPTALADIDVDGGDPTVGDTVIVNGTAGVDTISFTPTSANAGAVQVNALPLVTLTTVEHVTINGQGGNDNITVTTPATIEVITFLPGVDATEGMLAFRTGAAGSLLGMNYVNVGANTSLTLADAGGGRNDILEYNATNADDRVFITSAGFISLTEVAGGLLNRAIPITANGVSGLNVFAYDGNDLFLVPGNHPFATFGVTLQGGNPDNGAGDTLNFTGSGAGAVTLDLAAGTVMEAGFGLVRISGIETVNIDANNMLTVTGTLGNDVFDVTPLNADNDGTFTHNRTPGVTFNYSDATTATFTGGAGGDDLLSVYGDEGADAITAGAATVAVDGGVVTVGADIDELNVLGLGGDDNINLAAFTTAVRTEIYAGDGSDTVVGTAQPDIIYGGSGDDFLMGATGNDTIYGEGGNDRFGDPQARDAAANDSGNDFFDGGDGSDEFFWDPGDGDDRVEGGAGASDQIFFFGSGGNETFNLFADSVNPSRFHLFRSLGSIDIDAADIEEVNLATLGGTDTVLVGRDLAGVLADLTTTTVRAVDVDLGADGAGDQVFFDGRPANDNLAVSVSGAGVKVAGLSYDLRIAGADATLDRLTVRGNEGDDDLQAAPGVENLILITLDGGAGDDSLRGNGQLTGGDGDDTIVGEPGADPNLVDGGLGGDTILVEGTDGADVIELSLNASGFLVANVNGTLVTYAAGPAPGGPITGASIERILVQGKGGDDELTVDSTNGLIQIPIEYDGGSADDSLRLVGAAVDASTYTPGPAVDQGTIVHVSGGATQTVHFTGLEPVIDLVPAATLTVNGTNADNHINYSNDIDGAIDTGVISIDGFEAIEFANKTDVIINSLAGADVINISQTAVPAGLTGAITINDANTGAADRLIITGSRDAETFEYAPDNPDGGTISWTNVTTGDTFPDVVFLGVAAVEIDGRSDLNDDSLTVRTEAGLDFVVLEAGAFFDSGTVRVRSNAGTESAAPLSFRALGEDAVLTFESGDPNARQDELEYLGFDGADVFNVTTANDGTIFLNQQIEVRAPGASNLVLRGREGDDEFNVPGNHPFSDGILVDGGNNTGDVLDFLGAGGVVTVDLEAATLAEAGSDAVAYSGVEIINLDAGGIGPMILGTTTDDDLTVTVFDEDSGKIELGLAVQQNGQTQSPVQPPLINYFNLGGDPITIDLRDPAVGADQDTLVVVGSAAPQTFDVSVPAGTVAIDDNGDAVNDGLLDFLNAESLEVFGLEGSDTFNVTPGAIPVFIDGGDPIGVNPGGDVLNVAMSTFFPGPENDEGAAVLAGNEPVSFDHIERLIVGPMQPCPMLIVGTTGDDDITVIARDESYILPPAAVPAGLDGRQDFTVSVNGGPEILFIDQPDLFIDALAGDDDIVIRTRAPNLTDWAVDVRVVGGPPSAETGDQGDVVEVETPGAVVDEVYYTPTGSDTGVLLIDENADADFDAGTDTRIQILAFFELDCPPGGEPVDYRSSPGGAEAVVYDGEGGNDEFTVRGDAGAVGAPTDDIIVHTPGEAFDEGRFRVNNHLGIDYQNLGADAILTVDGLGGDDTLVVDGTDHSDTFEVDDDDPVETSGAVTVTNSHGERIAIRQANVENLTLDGLEGDDDFIINHSQPYVVITVNGGGPGGSDSLTINGGAGTDETFTVNPGVQPGEGDVEVDAVIHPYTGIEHLFLVANAADADDLIVNDDRRDNLWTVSAGTVGDLVQIDGRESIDYNDFTDVTLVNLAGTDTFRVSPTNLVGFSGAFTVEGDAAAPVDDVLELIGTPGNDVVTSTADSVTVNGVAITAGANLIEVNLNTLAGDDNIDLDLVLAGVRKVVDAGEGIDLVNLSGATGPATIRGGDGNDTLTGTPQNDIIYGGRGDDVLIGAGGNDTIYGEEGNDRFGEPAMRDAAPNDPGNDFFDGGAGSDEFFWDPGDGDDRVEGGAGDSDQIFFFGNDVAAGEQFFLFADTTTPSRFHLFRVQGAIDIDAADVEEVNLATLGGTDTVTVGRSNTGVLSDLTTTTVRNVDVSLGADGAADNVFVDGRPLDDNLLVSVSNGTIKVAGLRYDVRLDGSDATLDRLTVRGNEGDDTIVAQSPVEDAILLTLSGGVGDDFVSGEGRLIGGDGDDVLEGGDGVDTIFGDSDDPMNTADTGEDTIIATPGNDTINGGPQFDTLLIRGTAAADRIDVRQTAADMIFYSVDAPAYGGAADPLQGDLTATDTITNLEQATIQANAGADTIRVAIADTLFNMAGASLRMTVFGGDDQAQDRLGIIDVDVADLSILREGQNQTSGTVEIGPANAEPFLHVFSEVEFVQVIADTLAPGANPQNVESPGLANRLVVFKFDPFELNNDRNNATHLGANQTVNLDPTIDPGPGAFGFPADTDWYRVVAEVTGTIDFQIFFEQIAEMNGVGARPGLPGSGNLNLMAFDADGTAIANFGTVDADDNARIRIPAVEGQVYYLQVVGAGAAVNAYDVTVINHAPPTPFDIELSDNLVILTGAQEVPPVNTAANGTANFQFNPATGRFNLDMFVSGIELVDATPLPQLTGAHIHVAAPGVDGPIIVPFNLADWAQEPAGIRLRLTDQLFPAANLADLLAGNTYLNVHSSANLDGEVRGQINIQNILGVTDTGRSQFDDVTRDNTPTIYLRLDDAILLNDLPGNANGVPGASPPDEAIPIPFNNTTGASPVNLAPGFRVAIFDESDTHSPVLMGFAQPVAGLNGVYAFTFVTPLADGSHFISARVQMIDPADNDVAATMTRATGFGPRSESLEIVVDTQPPPVFFGQAADPTDGLSPEEGVIPQPPTVVDNKTNDSTPTFWGVAEANAVVRVWLDFSPNNGVDNFDLLLGTDQAIPIDGTNAFPNGQWIITSLYDLNDPDIVGADSDPATPGVQPLGVDGLRRLLVTAEDLAGNLNPGVTQAQALEIFIDTQGPQVTGVFIGQTDLIGLAAGNTLVRFNSAAPSNILATTTVTGLNGGTLVGIDFRPADGMLYGVVDGPQDRVVIINPVTGAVTASATLNADPTDATAPFTALAGAVFGVDFNPAADRLRVVSDTGQNVRINVTNGRVITDANLPANADVTAAAYTNNLAGAASTTLYDIDFTTDRLLRQDPPNSGTLVDVGPLGVNAGNAAAFDIAAGTNTAYAALTVGGVGTGLYTINLNTGAATLVGGIGAGNTPLLGLTALPAFDLFDPKPTPAPTPLIDKLVIRVQDLPARVIQFPNPAVNPDVAINPGNFLVVGDSNGIIPIMSVTFTPDPIVPGQPATGTLTLMFFEPLPDDRFTLTVRDSLVDDVGNPLDGDSNAAEPQNDPFFPSGDGQPGGDFVARFTVDSRPEVAVYSGRTVFVDTNGNGILDPRNQQDFTNRDVIYRFGLPTDDLFVGNFATDFGAVADGFDKLAAYGNIGNGFRFLIDTDNDGVPEPIPGFPTNTAAINGRPVAGNFDGNAANGDEVGLFDGATWFLDTNSNFNVNPAEGDQVVNGVIRGVPIVGDFDGNGVDDLATFNDFRNRFEIDLLGPGLTAGDIDRILRFGFPGVNDQPVAADFNQDGIDDLGLFVPQQGAGTPEEQAFFHILVSQTVAGAPQPLWESDRATQIAIPADLVGILPAGANRAVEIHFRPEPFGDDLLLPFGEDFAIPLFGNFDPPVGANVGTPQAPIGQGQSDTNPNNNLDVNDDGVVTVTDMVPILDALRTAGGPHQAFKDDAAPFLDVDSDDTVSVNDLVPIITFLRAQNEPGGGEGEAEALAQVSSPTFVGVFVTPRREEEAHEAAVADASPSIDATTLEAVAADVAATTGGGEEENAPLTDDSGLDDLDDAISAIAEDQIQTG